MNGEGKIVSTSNLYVAVYLYYLQRYKGENIKYLEITDDQQPLGNNQNRKVFKFEVDSKEAFDKYVQDYFQGDHKLYVDSLKIMIPILNIEKDKSLGRGSYTHRGE